MPINKLPNNMRRAFVYRDEAGQKLLRIVQLARQMNSKPRKQIAERWEAGTWRRGLKKTRHVLYRLRCVMEARSVFIVPDEAEAKALLALGITATTCPFGLSRWRPEFNKTLAGKKIAILPRHDAIGRLEALQVAASVLQSAASVRVIELPGVPRGGNATDWISAGGTRMQLRELCIATPRLTKGALNSLSRLSGPRAVANGSPKFTVNDDGIFAEVHPGESERISARVDVLSETRDIDRKNWGRLLAWKDGEGTGHERDFPMEQLVNQPGKTRAELLREGLEFISPNRDHRVLFMEYLLTARAPKRVRSVRRVGWHHAAYVLPDRVIARDGDEETIYQASGVTAHFATRGTCQDWKEQIGRMCSGNSRLLLAVSCAFAGPLLKLINGESAGFHFTGGTSTGKSSALIVAGSVLGGGGPNGFSQTWYSTANALEATAETHNDATLILDELSQVDPARAVDVAYLLGNGVGKSRLRGSCTSDQLKRWRLFFLSAGELTLAAHASTAGKRSRGGAEIRFINIEADGGEDMGLFENLHGFASPDEFARHLRHHALQTYGAPFRKFLRRLVKQQEPIAKVALRFQEKFRRRYVPVGASGEVRRAADRFALVAVAGELATQWGITGWQRKEAVHAAARLFREWLASRSQMGSADMDEVVGHIRELLATKGISRFAQSNGVSADSAVFIRTHRATGNKEFQILQHVFERDFCWGLPADLVAGELERRGYLRRGGDRRSTSKERLPGYTNPKRVYCIHGSILSAGRDSGRSRAS